MYTAAAVLPRKIDNTINDLVDAHSTNKRRLPKKRLLYAFECVRRSGPHRISEYLRVSDKWGTIIVCK